MSLENRAIRKSALILLIALAACNKQPAGEPTTRIDIGSGKAIGTPASGKSPKLSPKKSDAKPHKTARASACSEAEFDGARFTHCIADPATTRIAMALGPKGGAPYRSFAKLRDALGSDAQKVVFAVNGGMFDGEGKPIGYYVQAGKRLKQLNRNDGPGNFHMKPNGVFFGSGDKWQIRTADDFYAHIGTRPDFGTQSGPMLVIKGKLHPQITRNGPSKAIRNGVGVDRRGRAHFVISDGPVSFGQLARYFRDELKTPNALFLDGRLSALWDPANKRIDHRAALGPMILVESK